MLGQSCRRLGLFRSLLALVLPPVHSFEVVLRLALGEIFQVEVVRRDLDEPLRLSKHAVGQARAGKGGRHISYKYKISSLLAFQQRLRTCNVSTLTRQGKASITLMVYTMAAAGARFTPLSSVRHVQAKHERCVEQHRQR